MRRCRGAGLFRGREPADRVRRRRLHDGPPRRRARATLLDFFVAAPGHGRDRAARRAGPGAGPLRRRDRADVLRRARLLRRAGHRGRARARAAPLRLGAARRAGRARRAARPRRRAAERQQAYMLEILAPIHDVAGTRELYAPRGRPSARGTLRLPGARRGARTLRAEGAEPFYRGEVAAAISDYVVEHGGSSGRATSRPTRRSSASRSPPFRGTEVLTNPPPSAGDPDRLLPGAARAARAGQRPGAAGRGDGGRQRRAGREFAEASTGRGWRRPPRRRPRPRRRPARLDHPHRRDGRRRGAAPASPARTARARGCSSRHRRDPQQHARRGGPQPARLPPDRAGAPGAVDDGADRGPARRRDRSRARQRRFQPDPLGDPADGGAGGRAGHAGRRGGGGAAPALRGGRGPGRAGDRPGGAGPARGARPGGRPLARDQPILRRRAGGRARPRTGELSGGGDPRRGGAVAVGATTFASADRLRGGGAARRARGGGRAARLELLERLAGEGVPLEELRSGRRRAAGAAAGRARDRRRRARYSAREDRRAPGLDVELLRRFRAALGVPYGDLESGSRPRPTSRLRGG